MSLSPRSLLEIVNDASKRQSGTVYSITPRLQARKPVFVVLVAVVWLQPKIQAWLEGRNAGGPDASTEVEQSDSEPSIVLQHSADRKRVVINDVDVSWGDFQLYGPGYGGGDGASSAVG